MRTKKIFHKSELPTAVDTILTIVRYLLWGALVLTAIIIASLNATPTVVNYFWGVVSLPLYLVLITCFALGWLIGMGIHLTSQIKLHIYNRRLEQRYRELEDQIVKLKKDFIPDESEYSSVTRITHDGY